MIIRVGAGRYDIIKIIKIYIQNIYKLHLIKIIFRISQKKTKTTKNSFSKNKEILNQLNVE